MPNRRRRRVPLPSAILAWAALAGAALLAAGCSSSSRGGPPGADGKIIAVGAESEYADVIAQVGGKYVQASAIMSNPNTDPHTFEASASTGRLVNAARLVVQNGLGYDTFMDTIEKAVPDSGRRVDRGAEAARPAGQHAEPPPVVRPRHDAQGRRRDRR